MYSDADAAALYNVLNPWGRSEAFFLSLVMAAPSILDVGCGTGTMLHRARDAGHDGRLTGVDPDRAALALARQRRDIEWVEGKAAAMTWEGEFALAVMMSHAFQFLVSDEEVQASLVAVRRALIDGCHFVFDTRNPAVREWDQWHPGNPIDVVDPRGRPVRISYEVVSVAGDVITVTETTSDPDGETLRVDRAPIRFLHPELLARMVEDAGFVIEARYGGWAHKPFAPDAPELVTVARRA